MRRHIKIAIAITMMGLFDLMFWQTILDVTGKDAAVAGAQSKRLRAVVARTNWRGCLEQNTVSDLYENCRRPAAVTTNGRPT